MMSEQTRNERIAKREQLAVYTQARVDGASMRQAAREAGFKPSIADKAGTMIEPKVQKRIADLLEEHGAGNDRIAKVVGDALVATKETKFGTQDDHWTRIKAAEFAASVTGQSQPKANINVGIQINLPAGMAERFASFSSPVVEADPQS